MKITNEAIKKAAAELFSIFHPGHNIRVCRASTGSCSCEKRLSDIAKAILSHCTETEWETTYACTDEFADEVLASDDVHRECAEEFVSYAERDAYNTWSHEEKVAKIQHKLARHFPNHKAMKEALELYLDAERTNELRGSIQKENILSVLDELNALHKKYDLSEVLDIHQSTMDIWRLAKNKARTALGLEGK